MKSAVSLHPSRPALHALGLAVLTLALSACGGGGGNSGTSVFTGGGTGTTPGSGNAAQQAPKASVSLSSTTVTAGAPAVVTVTLLTAGGLPIPGQVVNFSTAAGLGTFSAASALTDDSGKATTTLSPAASGKSGADSVVVTTKINNTEVTASTGFQTTATNVSISRFSADLPAGTKLAAYGQTALTVELAGTSPTAPVSLALTSSCVTAGKGTLTPAQITTTTGRAVFTFRDGGCGAIASQENLQVSVVGTALTQSLTVPVSSPSVASIGFLKAEPQVIYLKGTGSIENSTLTFRVKDANNNGLPEQWVELEPTTLAGGLTLDDQQGKLLKKTDSNGDVQVRINAGTVPTPVRIKATLQNSNISTVSSALAIAVGLPSQLNFSLAAGTHNIEGYNIDGTPNTFTVRAADRMGNPVPVDTAINFVTEGGQVQSTKGTQLDSNGIAVATANFASSEPRPVDGRVTVLAYALGEKSFLDQNGDNVYSVGEPFMDLGKVYLDRLYDGIHDNPTDQFIDLSLPNQIANASCDGNDGGNALLARNVTIPSVPGTCSGQWGRAYVRRAVQTVFSTSTARPIWDTVWPSTAMAPGGQCGTSLDLITGYTNNAPNRTNFKPVGGERGLFGMPGASVISFLVADANPVAYNPMAAGTQITATGTDGLTVTMAGGDRVPSTLTPSRAAINYKFDGASAGTISINIRSPGGTTTTIPVFVTTAPPPSGFTTCSN